MPQKEGWVEITQSNKINQPLTLKLNNKRPKNDDEKADLSKFEPTNNFGLYDLFNAALGFRYIDNPEDGTYDEPQFQSCMQLDETHFVITGQQNWIIEVRPKSEAHDVRTNLIPDKNLYLHYYWRVKQEIGVNFESQRMDLLWISHDQKIMMAGSTSQSKLYLYNLHVDKTLLSTYIALELSKELHHKAYQFHLEEQLRERDEEKNLHEIIQLDYLPAQVIPLGLGQFMVLYFDTGLILKRHIFEVTTIQNYTKKIVKSSSWEALKDIAGDYLAGSKSFDKSPALVLLIQA